MFTGIITDVGEIIELEKRGDLRARIKTNYDAKGIAFGASICLLYTSPSPRDLSTSRMPSSA